MEQIYLSSDTLRTLSQIVRVIILEHKTVIKMSDDEVLVKVFDFCENCDSQKIMNMFYELIDEMSRPITDEMTSFIFQADQRILNIINSDNELGFDADAAAMPSVAKLR